MQIIDGDWIKRHLSNKRGEKARLAAAMGIDAQKMSRILSGERQVQIHEMAAAMEFFGKPTGMSEPEATPWEYPAESPEATLAQVLGVGLRHPQVYTARIDAPGFAICRGDLLTVDLNTTPKSGDIVLCNLVDAQIGAGETVLRRYLPPWLAAPSPGTPPMLQQDSAGPQVTMFGVVRSILRRAP